MKTGLVAWFVAEHPVIAGCLAAMALYILIWLSWIILRLKSRIRPAYDPDFDGRIRAKLAQKGRGAEDVKKITGDYHLVHNTTGKHYWAWIVPHSMRAAYALYHATNGRIKVFGEPGDILDPEYWLEENGEMIQIRSGQMLLYDYQADRFEAINWSPEAKLNYSLEP